MIITVVSLPPPGGALDGGVRTIFFVQKAALFGVPVYGVADARARDAWNAYELVGKELSKL